MRMWRMSGNSVSSFDTCGRNAMQKPHQLAPNSTTTGPDMASISARVGSVSWRSFMMDSVKMRWPSWSTAIGMPLAIQSRSLHPYAHLQMHRRCLASIVRPLDADNVVPGLLVAVRRHRVAVLRQRLHVAVGVNLHRRAAVAEVPQCVALSRAERPHLERDPVARLDVEGRRIAGVNAGRQVLARLLVKHFHDGEVVVDVPGVIDDAQHLAVATGLRVLPRRHRALALSAVAELPAIDQWPSGPRPR